MRAEIARRRLPLPNRPAGLISSTIAITTKIDGARRLRIEHLGQALDHAEREAGDDRAEDRAHAADHDDGEDDDDEFAPISGLT